MTTTTRKKRFGTKADDPRVAERNRLFGRRVRVLRETLGLSQEKLAELAGCDRQTINRVENARYSRNLSDMFLIADALGVTLGFLLDGVESAEAAVNRSREARERAALAASERRLTT